MSESSARVHSDTGGVEGCDVAWVPLAGAPFAGTAFAVALVAAAFAGGLADALFETAVTGATFFAGILVDGVEVLFAPPPVATAFRATDLVATLLVARSDFGGEALLAGGAGTLGTVALRAEALLAGALRAGALVAGALRAGVLRADALVTGAFLAGAFLAGAFLAGAFLAGALLVGALLVGALLVGALLAAVLFAGAFLAAALPASTFFTGDFAATTLATAATWAAGAFFAAAFCTGAVFRATTDALAAATFRGGFWTDAVARGDCEVGAPWRRSTRPIRPTVAMTTPFVVGTAMRPRFA